MRRRSQLSWPVCAFFVALALGGQARADIVLRVPDDQSTVDAALAAARALRAHTSEPIVIRLAAGVYAFDHKLKIDVPHLTLEGNAAPPLDADGRATVPVAHASVIQLAGTPWAPNYDPGPGGDWSLVLIAADDVTVSKIHFRSLLTAVAVDGVVGARIEDCVVDGGPGPADPGPFGAGGPTPIGLQVRGSTCTIARTYVSGGFYGLRSLSRSDLTIQDSRFTGNIYGVTLQNALFLDYDLGNGPPADGPLMMAVSVVNSDFSGNGQNCCFGIAKDAPGGLEIRAVMEPDVTTSTELWILDSSFVANRGYGFIADVHHTHGLETSRSAVIVHDLGGNRYRANSRNAVLLSFRNWTSAVTSIPGQTCDKNAPAVAGNAFVHDSTIDYDGVGLDRIDYYNPPSLGNTLTVNGDLIPAGSHVTPL